jgi:hypothetical protein
MVKDKNLKLLSTLEERFYQFPQRHPLLKWDEIKARLEKKPVAINTLYQMEQTGGEPDVVSLVSERGQIVFVDCSAESPLGRRSYCYDALALSSRKENKPNCSAVEVAHAMGVSILTEAHYRELQLLGEFDLKTSSWIATPPNIRNLGGALFCDRRYGNVFTYHNGAQSYYGSRGFRGVFKL